MATKLLTLLFILTLSEIVRSDSLLFLQDDNHFHEGEKLVDQTLLDTRFKVDKNRYFKLLQRLRGHLNYVYSVSQLEDGRLASASADYSIKIWDLTTSEAVQTLKGHIDSVRSVIQLKDGRLASASRDKNN